MSWSFARFRDLAQPGGTLSPIRCRLKGNWQLVQ
jgi:hypothetical protein